MKKNLKVKYHNLLSRKNSHNYVFTIEVKGETYSHKPDDDDAVAAVVVDVDAVVVDVVAVGFAVTVVVDMQLVVGDQKFALLKALVQNCCGHCS